ncbi:hypothetical protein B7463_g10089, partial [Scytalidium lignicola]
MDQILPGWSIDDPFQIPSSFSASTQPEIDFSSPSALVDQKPPNITGTYLHRNLTTREIEITELEAQRTLELIHRGHWTCVEVTKAFCHRALLAHQLTNCLHEICIDQAIADATILDEHFAEHRAPVGPLHGLVMSLTDSYHAAGMETTLGLSGWIGTFEGYRGTGKERVFESEIVRQLKRAGAIFFCKTAVPQALVDSETVNNIVGFVWNPSNRRLSCTGSSGGEGALLAQKGSMASMGIDQAGGIRIPASDNGLYCLRVSTGRIPQGDIPYIMNRQSTILPGIGPIANSIGSLRLILKSILEAKPWLYDPLVVELAWREDKAAEILELIDSSQINQPQKKPLAFGILATDGFSTPQPPIRRALRMAVEALTRRGHRVMAWEPPTHIQAYNIAMNSFLCDGGQNIHRAIALSGEPMTEQLKHLYGTSPFPEMTAGSLSEITRLRYDFQTAYLKYWESTRNLTGTGQPVNAVISPVSFSAGIRPHGNIMSGMDILIFWDPETVNPSSYDIYLGHSIWVDVLDYTSVVVPITFVDKVLDTPDCVDAAVNALDRKATLSLAVDADLYHGTPVGLQIVCPRFHEESALALAELLVHALDVSRNV